MPTMTSCQRVHDALEFKPVDRLPRDLSGMRSTGISCFAYPRLVEALGLPPRRPRIYDTGQMLALPDLDVLDALGCDCVTVDGMLTNAFEQPELWHDYDFNGRLKAKVLDPQSYRVAPDGTIFMGEYHRMGPDSTVFNSEHAGCGIDLSTDIPPPDVEAYRRGCEEAKLTPEKVKDLAAFYAKVRREAKGRAIFGCEWSSATGIGIGMGLYPMQCVLYPEDIATQHDLTTQRCIHNLRLLLPLIKDNVDVLMMSADDWGTQTSLVASPDVFRTLFKPYYTRIMHVAHELAPRVKFFLHSCGAIHPLLGDIAECGFDIVNPVQWSAGGKTPAEWKAAAGKTLAFWGGGVNAQETLPLKSVEAVRSEVRRVVPELSKGGGYVFANTHNILAEIDAQKVVAMYDEAGKI